VLSERVRRSGRPLSDEDQVQIATAERCRLQNIRERIQPILESFRKARGQGQSQT